MSFFENNSIKYMLDNFCNVNTEKFKIFVFQLNTISDISEIVDDWNSEYGSKYSITRVAFDDRELKWSVESFDFYQILNEFISTFGKFIDVTLDTEIKNIYFLPKFISDVISMNRNSTLQEKYNEVFSNNNVYISCTLDQLDNKLLKYYNNYMEMIIEANSIIMKLNDNSKPIAVINDAIFLYVMNNLYFDSLSGMIRIKIDFDLLYKAYMKQFEIPTLQPIKVDSFISYTGRICKGISEWNQIRGGSTMKELSINYTPYNFLKFVQILH